MPHLLARVLTVDPHREAGSIRIEGEDVAVQEVRGRRERGDACVERSGRAGEGERADLATKTPGHESDALPCRPLDGSDTPIPVETIAAAGSTCSRNVAACSMNPSPL